MIVGIGVDVVDVERFELTLVRTPGLRRRLFTAAEANLPPGSLAGRFAAKEALAKALGAPGGLRWHDAEVVKNADGQPSFVVTGTVEALVKTLGVTGLHLSISHDAGISSAMVVAEGTSGGPV
ncbi:MAG TPA: holo-ACP synthase [Candidatus Limnocylindria bacterium]|nr:holo-ACP synthase [Candidatus Limnocylindria bacterium]